MFNNYMHIYNTLNQNLQKRIDSKIHRNNKILMRQIHIELVIYILKKNLYSCNINPQNVNLMEYCNIS